MSSTETEVVYSNVPSRLDRLPWSSFHWTVVFVLGITWILDGLEVTFGSAISTTLQSKESLGFSATDIGALGSFYVSGAVIGALVFGYLTDKFGRKSLFYLTLLIYLAGITLSGFAWNLWSFCMFRFLTGAGIGGEYSAINSAIDELIPARVRGQVDLMINGSYWLGAILSSLLTLILLDPKFFPIDLGWRIGFLAGAVLTCIVLFFRRTFPESPRWLLTQGRQQEAEQIVSQIEFSIESKHKLKLDRSNLRTIPIHVRTPPPFLTVVRILFTQHTRKAMVSLALIASQAFMYNAIFFTYGLVLTTFYGVSNEQTGIYLLPFAIGNFLGPFTLGAWFDSKGRRIMIASTYAISGVLLVVSGGLLALNLLTAVTQTLLWTAIFFFGSSAASSAYLTVSEIFPLETRGLSIAIFFSAGTGAGGILAPWIFSHLIGSGSRELVFYGYTFAALLMIGAAAVQWFFGFDCERKSLEEISELDGLENSKCTTTA